MTTVHKHAELIKQWADGAIIQCKVTGSASWSDCVMNDPSWSIGNEYRIKPELKPDFSKFMGLYSDGDGSHHNSGVYPHAMRHISREIKTTDVVWNICNKLELIFDGETKELKGVKIHGKD